jgi:hypothetical protein
VKYWIGVASADHVSHGQELDTLSLTSATPNWGYAFRMGLVEISAEDFAVIATAMQASI